MKHLIRPRLFTFIFSLFFTISLGALLAMAVISYVRLDHLLSQNVHDKLIAISNGRRALIGQVLDDIYSSCSERASAFVPLTIFERLESASKKIGIQTTEYK